VDGFGRASRRSFGPAGGVAPASSMGYGAPSTAWANSGDGVGEQEV
jgi:hypothetical protein